MRNSSNILLRYATSKRPRILRLRPWLVTTALGIGLGCFWTFLSLRYIRNLTKNDKSSVSLPRRLMGIPRSKGAIVIAGQIVVNDKPCNIAQYDLDHGKWILKGMVFELINAIVLFELFIEQLTFM